MDKKDKKRISAIADEAARLKKDYPTLSFKEALEKAKEIYKCKEVKQ